MRIFLALSIALASGCIHAPPTGPTPPLTERVLAADGWPLAVHRYAIPAGVAKRSLPIVLCHGLGSNHHSLDLDEGGSLARNLAAAGFDVWAMDLRNHGDSRARPTGAERRSKIAFDDYVRLDAPAVIAHVREKTSAPGVIWIGHSMGGIVAYAYLGRGGEGVAAFVAVASPGDVRQEGAVAAISGLSGFISLFPQLYARRYAAMHAAIFRGWSEWHVDNLVYNRKNLTARERMLLKATSVDNLSRGELRTFRRWIKTHRFDSADGVDDYAANLSHITIPALLVSGSADVIVPAPNVQFVMERLGSADKTHRMFGISEGDAHDFGHVDLVSGSLATREVFPTVCAWLLEHDPPPNSP